MTRVSPIPSENDFQPSLTYCPDGTTPHQPVYAWGINAWTLCFIGSFCLMPCIGYCAREKRCVTCGEDLRKLQETIDILESART